VGNQPRWQDSAETFELDGTFFTYGYGNVSAADQFVISKPKSLVEEYVALAERFQPSAIVELGIRAGGGTALLALLFRPRKLVAFELDDSPVPALTEFVDTRRLGAVVRPYFGIDQGDKPQVDAIVSEEFLGAPIDLVIDDASHLLAATRASFEVLFPRVRPGGLYVIEDWHVPLQAANKIALVLSDPSSPESAALTERIRQGMESDVPVEQPVVRLVLQLLLARAISGDAVEEINITADWVTVRRGPAVLDPTTFRVADLYIDHYGLTT
jgi:hypothetical protein